MKAGILFDSTKCIDCEACVAACKEKNGLPPKIDPRLSAYTWTVVEEQRSRGAEEQKKVFVRRMCMHCETPTCVSVCPVGALRKTPSGPVVYDARRCIGCRYCIMACPFNVPKYQWDRVLPLVQKCTLCPDRIAAGQATACAAVCPTGATQFGDRDDLIQEAQGRLKAAPGKYVPRIYGIEEAGGTSVLMMSSIPFDQLGFRPNLLNLPNTPLPNLTWRVLSELPDVVMVGGVFLYGIWWITNRRTLVQRMEAEEKKGRPPESGRSSR